MCLNPWNHPSLVYRREVIYLSTTTWIAPLVFEVLELNVSLTGSIFHTWQTSGLFSLLFCWIFVHHRQVSDSLCMLVAPSKYFCLFMGGKRVGEILLCWTLRLFLILPTERAHTSLLNKHRLSVPVSLLNSLWSLSFRIYVMVCSSKPQFPE